MKPRVWEWGRGVWEPCAGVIPEGAGFRFGMQIFATMRQGRGGVWAWERHLAVVEAAWEALAEEGVRLETKRMHENLPLSGDQLWRLQLLWDGDGLEAKAPAPRVLLLAGTLPEPVKSGWHAVLVDEPLPPWHAGAKFGAAYAWRTAILRSARRTGADEALLRFADGRLSSWCFGNLLMRIEGRWKVAAGADVRAGVFADWLFRRGLVEPAELEIADLESAEALAFCNSVRGVVPVLKLGERTFPVVPEYADWQSDFSKEVNGAA